MTKKINSKLTSEQKLVLFEDGTEAPVTTVLIVVKNYLIQMPNMKVVQVGLHFINHYPKLLKLKQIPC
jgi:hypothetical protein